MDLLHTPVLIITYKRLDTTLKVLESVAKVKPAKLYIANNAPNPLNVDDGEKVKAVRAVFEKELDWSCQVITLFRTKHLSAKESISSSIAWFFENESEGIILEDDCVVEPSFYYFAQECLERYRSDDQVTQISASNFQDGNVKSNASYYFSRYNHIWGWAGWRRSWKHFDSYLKEFNTGKSKHIRVVNKIFPRKQDRTYWIAMYDYVKSGNLDTWDYQWMFCMWSQNGRSIIPQVNTVINIGFGNEATNTLNQSEHIVSLKSKPIDFPLIHTPNIDYNSEADIFSSDHFFFISKSYKLRHLKIRVAKFLPNRTKKRIKKMLLRLNKIGGNKGN
jgi:hypothetical protein